MNTVGVFAGRGDVVLAMGAALILGVWVGYHVRGWIESFKEWRQNK